ncbi:MAG: LptF/LptG family permease [Candidatus Hydrogenedentota bacterium]
MKTLDRFFLFRFAASFFVFFLLFTSLFILAELFDLKDKISLGGDSFPLLMFYLALRLPFLAYASAPISVILATIFVFASRAHLSEVVAVQAGGISIIRLAASILAAASCLTILLLLGTEFKIPQWSDRADYMRRVNIQKKLPPKTEFRDLVFQARVASKGTVASGAETASACFIMTDLFVPQERTMKNVTILWPDAEQTELSEVEFHRELHYTPGEGWKAPGAKGRVYRNLPVPKVIELIAASGGVKLLSDKPLEAVSISTMAREIADLKSLDENRTFEKLDDEIFERYVRISAKLAFPCSVPFLALLGAGLGARVGRRRGIGAAIGNALLCTLGYMILVQTALRLSELAAHSPALRTGAIFIPWIVPAIIGSLSGYYLRLQRS